MRSAVIWSMLFGFFAFFSVYAVYTGVVRESVTNSLISCAVFVATGWCFGETQYYVRKYLREI